MTTAAPQSRVVLKQAAPSSKHFGERFPSAGPHPFQRRIDNGNCVVNRFVSRKQGKTVSTRTRVKCQSPGDGAVLVHQRAGVTAPHSSKMLRRRLIHPLAAQS